MSEPKRMSPAVERMNFGEGAIGVHPTGSGGTARVTWLPLPGAKAQTHCHVIVWTDSAVFTTTDVARIHAGTESQKLLDQL